jgi:hypothetical protein
LFFVFVVVDVVFFFLPYYTDFAHAKETSILTWKGMLARLSAMQILIHPGGCLYLDH